MAGDAWTVTEGGGAIVACAVHAGSEVRREVLPLMALRRRQRFLEEDPYTDQLAEAAATKVVVHRSRFEVDMNRSRDRAVYRSPGDAWGLTVWRGAPPGAGRGCCRAGRVKKFFMDGHNGVMDDPVWAGVQAALAATVPGLLDGLETMRSVRRLRRRRTAVA